MAFRGKVALITGAASGMGRLATQRLAAAGARVAALDVNEEGLEETARGLSSVWTWVLDVSDRKAVESVVPWVEAELGSIDRVVNAAGIMPTSPLVDQDVGEIHRLMEVNYGGTVNVTKATLPGMLARGHGDVIQFASIAGWVPTLHFGAYNASKFAVVAFTEVLHHEIRGKGVRITCVCPGLVDTPLLAQARSQPRILQKGPPPLPPARVLDAVERALERERLWVFVNWQTAVGWRMRRLVPRLMWWIDHRAERA